MEDASEKKREERPLRVLVVDDSVLFRNLVVEVLRDVPWIEVVGCASDGERALEKIPLAAPDVLTVDLAMPRMDGCSLLRKLRELHPGVGAIVLSAYTREGSRDAVEALEAGAFDCLLKPEAESLARSAERLREDLVERLLTFRSCLLRRASAHPAAAGNASAAEANGRRAAAEVVALAASTGGPRALGDIMSGLPSSLPASVLVVQHIPREFTASLAESLQRRCALRIREAADGDLLERGTVLIAPGDRHMSVAAVEGSIGKLRVVLSDEPLENGCRPSADHLFRSLARTCGRRTLAVVLTGMGSDGLLGARHLKRAGGTVFAEDPSTSMACGMPRAIIEAGLADRVLRLESIAAAIVEATTPA